ncbi:MAG: NUDIX domain-containing protein [Candidatus Obscuribacterales bacterium]|nr:NUDIX domain-containing protein [Candidatus Obscuribacterales bacterium]
MKESAGTLLYRTVDGAVEVLLVHASGNYNKKSKWSIPKGVPDQGENMEQAARRETLEETGVSAGRLESLGFVEYTKSRKRVHCFWGPAPEGAEPHCASWEVDRAEFIDLEKAKDIIHQDQFEFIARLESMIVKQSK